MKNLSILSFGLMLVLTAFAQANPVYYGHSEHTGFLNLRSMANFKHLNDTLLKGDTMKNYESNGWVVYFQKKSNVGETIYRFSFMRKGDGSSQYHISIYEWEGIGIQLNVVPATSDTLIHRGDYGEMGIYAGVHVSLNERGIMTWDEVRKGEGNNNIFAFDLFHQVMEVYCQEVLKGGEECLFKQKEWHF